MREGEREGRRKGGRGKGKEGEIIFSLPVQFPNGRQQKPDARAGPG